jgi:hypothetical protein
VPHFIFVDHGLIFMKSIFRRPQLKFSGTNNRIMWMNERLTFFIDRPALMLLVPWLFYFAFDLSITLIFDLDFRGFSFAYLTVIAGFASSCVIFFWLIPGIFLPAKRLFPILVSLVSLAGIVFLKFVILEGLGISVPTWSDFAVVETIRLVNFFVVTFTVWAFYLLINTVREKNTTETKFEELKMAHQSLQLSPHFLLNLIGDITGKSIRFSPILFEDLRHYTTILRYGYLDPGGFNSLASEIDTVRSYLHCQRLRYGDSLYMEVTIDPILLEKDEYYMPKMLLLTLVENIFKHGIFQDASHPLIITAKWEERAGRPVFGFQSKNFIKSGSTGPSSGFGLQTARRLLNHYFKETSFISSQEGQIFTLSLSISYDTSDQTWPHR